MKGIFQKSVAVALAAAALSVPAQAETVSFSGTVTASRTHEVYATSDGIVESVPVTVGQSVSASDTVASLRTDKVYAEEDGVITAVFGRVGDLTDTITERYGAVIYMEDSVTYTLTATTEYAYDSVEAKTVYVGETVFLRSRSEKTRTGTGMITSVEGTEYTIHVTGGEFIVGESVSVYRDEMYTDEARIGRGDIERNSPMTVTGNGRIVSLYVEAGQPVKRGDLLMETLTGSGTNSELFAGVDGIVASISVTQGTAVNEDEVLSVIWPDDAMQIEIAVSEDDLPLIAVGDAVDVVFEWDTDSLELTGTVAFISSVPSDESDDTQYTVTVDFTPDASIRYGMSVTVNVTH